MKECPSDIVNEKCILTLLQMNQGLRQRLANKPEIHNRTVSRTLQGMSYRVKPARPLPAERKWPDVIHKRYHYASWFMRHAVVNHCVFIDECGYNIWTARNQGGARIGDRAYRQVSGQRRCNVTVALAISPTNDLVLHSAIIGGMNTQRSDKAESRSWWKHHIYIWWCTCPPCTAPLILAKIQNSRNCHHVSQHCRTKYQFAQGSRLGWY